jgi:hypothetical protein
VVRSIPVSEPVLFGILGEKYPGPTV